MQLAFNTHKFVKNLTGAGFTEQQAEILADEQVNLINNNLATGADVAAVKSDLEKQIGDLKIEQEKRFNEQEKQIGDVKSELGKQIGDVKSGLETQIGGLKLDIAEQETRLLKWMVGLMIGHAALTVTLIVKLTA